MLNLLHSLQLKANMFKKMTTARALAYVSIVVLLILLGNTVFRSDSFSMDVPKTTPAVELQFELDNYVQFSESTLQSSKARGQSLLFFAATGWCQTCSELENEIVARAPEIPSGMTVLKVDYDNDTEMNRKYGVTMQHTLVLLDSNGAEITRWAGGNFDAMLKKLSEI